MFEAGPNRTGNIHGMPRDELAGWDINSVTFACATLQLPDGESALSSRPISLQTQDFDPNDDFAHYYDGNPVNPTTSMNQTCAITIKLSRLSVTAVVQSVVPVAFIAGLSFLVFATNPDDLDMRLGTEVTLFLSLTAVQFVFATYLPLASYLTNFDVFILLSYSLIVVIILESFFVNFLCTRADPRRRRGYEILEAHKPVPAPPAQASPEEGEGRLSFGTMQEMGIAAAAESGAPRPLVHNEGQEKEQLTENGVGAEHADGHPGLNGAGTCRDEDLHLAETAQGTRRRASIFVPLRGFPRIRVKGPTLPRDPSHAFQLASKVDFWCGVSLFVIYVTLSVVNFTVGLAA